jgi:aspartate--ammonia ligase
LKYETLNLIDTLIAIKKIKDHFEQRLSKILKLIRVSAPLFVESNKGINDNLNGVEQPVSFKVGNNDIEIVHSLAKWKRMALAKYNLRMHSGLYTDMNAIRKDEELDEIHSIYVDQWDWEMLIEEKDRNLEFLKSIVTKIYNVLRETEIFIQNEYPNLTPKLGNEIYFITSQELLDMYPDLSAKERENKIVKEKKAVFLLQIGKILSNGNKHDGRSPDYDDFELNGDILVYNPVLDSAFELSSMGIRVNKESLLKQLEQENKLERLNLEYHQLLLNDKLPLTIGGGIGQSRMCMFFLNKRHIGEVQTSYWPKDIIEKCKKENIELL